MDFLPSEIAKYSEGHTSEESDLLNLINRETHLEVLKPRMLSGHLQGRLLALFSRMVNPEHVLEIGTYTGYATICLAEGLSQTGKIVTIDKNEELQTRVESYFADSQYAGQIEFVPGNALEVIPALTKTWDMVFIDADKGNYLRYYDMVFDQVKQGGYIIADNVLWSGKVADPDKQDHDTKKIREFNDTVHSDSRVENILLPVRDGLMIARKK